MSKDKSEQIKQHQQIISTIQDTEVLTCHDFKNYLNSVRYLHMKDPDYFSYIDLKELFLDMNKKTISPVLGYYGTCDLELEVLELMSMSLGLVKDTSKISNRICDTCNYIDHLLVDWYELHNSVISED